MSISKWQFKKWRSYFRDLFCSAKAYNQMPRAFSPALFGLFVCFVVATLLSLLFPAIAADYPQWWRDRNVVTNVTTTNNYAAVNAGQLKWIATQAAAEFNDKLSGGAGAAVNNMVAGLQNTNNYVAVNVGQVKAVAKPFYDRLIELSIASSYPWTESTADDQNYALANIGQVKNVFNFDAPAILADVIENQIAFSGELWQFRLPDDVFGLGSNVVYSACFADGSQLPDTMSFNPDTSTFEWVKAEKAGLYRIMVRGADGSTGSVMSSFYLTIVDKVSQFTDSNWFVAIDGNHAVGSGRGDQCGMLNTYQYDGSQWTRAGILTNSSWEGAIDQFGWSYYSYGYWTGLDLVKDPWNRRIAASYNALLRSSYKKDSLIAHFMGPYLWGHPFVGSSIHLSGSDAIVRASGTNIVYLNYLGLPGGNLGNPSIIGDNSASAMDLDGDTAIVGSKVYVRSGTEWNLEAALSSPSPAWPAIQGDTAFVSGKFFTRSGSNWIEEADMGEVPSGRPELKGDTLLAKAGSSPKLYRKIHGQWISLGRIPWSVDGLDLSSEQVVVLVRGGGGTLFVQLNVAPLAVADAYTCSGNGSLRIDSARGVLANDTDKNDNELRAGLVESPVHGSVSLSSDGSFIYTPQTGFIGSDTFTYCAFDGEYYSEPATVTINVAEDSDGDGMPDEWEIANGLDPYNGSDAFDDPDGDGICNLLEFRLGTDPHHADPSSLIQRELTARRITSRIVFPEFTARLAEAGETVASVLISVNRVLNWDNFYISRDEAGSLASKLNGLQLMINNQPVTFADGDASTLVTAYVPEGSTSIELALVALTNGLVSADVDTRWVKWDPTVNMTVTRTADTNDIYVAGIDEMHAENYIEVTLSIAQEPPIPGSYRLLAQASSSGDELLVSSNAGASMVEFVANSPFNEATLSLYGNGRSASHQGSQFLLRSGKGEKNVAEPLKVTVFDAAIDAASLFTMVRESWTEYGASSWNVLFGNIDVDLCAEGSTGDEVTGFLTLSDNDGNPINGISRIATNAGLHYFEVDDSAAGDRVSAEWEVKGQTARTWADACNVYANLAGYDALTAVEVTDGLEDSRGVLVCYTNEMPAARITVYSTGVGEGDHNVERYLWFSDPSKVRLFRNGSEVNLSNNSVYLVGNEQVTFTIVRDEPWSWDEEVMLSMSLYIDGYYVAGDSLLLVPSKVNIAVGSDSESVVYMDGVVFTGSVLPEEPVENWSWTVVKGQGDPATSVSNILATIVKNAVDNRFKIQARATVHGAEFFGEKELTAIIPRPDLTFDGLWEDAFWHPSGAPTETEPGGLLRVNANDDDGERGVDLNRDVAAPPLVSADPDLKRIGVALYPVLSIGTVSLYVPPSIRTWYSSGKGGEFPPYAQSLLMEKREWDLANQDDRDDFISLTSGGFWIEGMSKGSNPVTLSYENGLRSDTVNINTITADLRGFDARRTMELDYVLEQDEENGVLVAVNDDTPGLDPHEAKIQVSAVGRSGLSRQLCFYGSYEKLLVNGATPSQVMPIPGDSNIAVEYEISISDSWGISDTSRAELVVTDLSDPYNQRSWTDAVTFTSIRIDMIPDFNHDRKIDDADKAAMAANGPFRFWINDDDDSGYDGGTDIPLANGISQDWRDDSIVPLLGHYVVDGVRDLVDFFPVYVDIAQAVTALPKESYIYFIKQADGAINAVPTTYLMGYTDDAATQAGAYLTRQDVADTFVANDLILKQITSTGIEIPEKYLVDAGITGKGFVLLCEGRAPTQKPLVLEIRRKTDSSVILTSEMPLSLSGVEQMFRRLNIRDAVGGDLLLGGETMVGSPENYPDNLCSAANLIFAHGYAPDKEEDPMHGWGVELFKKFFWSGSKAKFHSILWRSGQGVQTEYQRNVTNAFATAPVLSEYVNGLAGVKEDRIIVAHSLGNVLVSSAISDYGMSVGKYFLLDAAVASEAYDQNIDIDTRLINSWWEGYRPETWSANWYQLFDEGSTRRKLTWRDRFKAVLQETDAYNLYSSGDEVFELHEDIHAITGILAVKWWLLFPYIGLDDPARYSWQKQECFKGTTYMDGLLALGGTGYAGWGFESELEGPDSDGNFQIVPLYTKEQANDETYATTEKLKAEPVFTRDPEWLVGDNELSTNQINEMLGMGIPALTPSAGRVDMNDILNSDHSKNLSTIEFQADGWPRNHPDYGTSWLHNDAKSMAYLYTNELFDHIVKAGGVE